MTYLEISSKLTARGVGDLCNANDDVWSDSAYGNGVSVAANKKNIKFMILPKLSNSVATNLNSIVENIQKHNKNKSMMYAITFIINHLFLFFLFKVLS